MPRVAIVTPDGLDAETRAARVSASLALLEPTEALLLLRDTSLTAHEQRDHEAALHGLCEERGSPLFVAREVAGDRSVPTHFRDRPGALDSIRELREWRPSALISVSTHAPEAAVAAAKLADVVYLGPIWPTAGKPTGLGVGALRLARRGFEAERGQLYAIGGIDAERAVAALEAGAFGVAGIRGFDSSALVAIAKAIRGRTSTHE